MALEKILKNSSGVPTGEYETVAGGTNFSDNPIGTILPFGGTNIPAGFLLCNGAEVLKTDYAELYAVIGDAFGTASVNTKFVLPDLRGEFLRGAGTNSHSGQGSGGTVGQHQDATTIPDFFTDGSNTWVTLGPNNSAITNSDGSDVGSSRYFTAGTSTGARTYGHKVRPTNTSVNYIIKAKQVALPADLESAVEDAVESVYGDVIPSDASASNKLTTQDMFKVITTPAMTRVGNSNGNVKQYIPNGYTLVKVEAVGYDQHQVFFDDRGYVFVFNIDSTTTSNWSQVSSSASIAYKLYCVKFN